MKHLQHLRRFTAVFGLLQHYCDHSDLQALRVAYLYTPAGRRFKVFCKNMFDILVLKTFHGAQLQVFQDLHAETMCVTPRCVCRFRKSREKFRRVEISWRWRRPGRFTFSANFQGRVCEQSHLISATLHEVGATPSGLKFLSMWRIPR